MALQCWPQSAAIAFDTPEGEAATVRVNGRRIGALQFDGGGSDNADGGAPEGMWTFHPAADVACGDFYDDPVDLEQDAGLARARLADMVRITGDVRHKVTLDPAQTVLVNHGGLWAVHKRDDIIGELRQRGWGLDVPRMGTDRHGGTVKLVHDRSGSETADEWDYDSVSGEWWFDIDCLANEGQVEGEAGPLPAVEDADLNTLPIMDYNARGQYWMLYAPGAFWTASEGRDEERDASRSLPAL